LTWLADDNGYTRRQDERFLSKGRLEAFSDAIIAIIMTIMVLELAAPTGSDITSLLPLLPKLLAYILSYTFLAIYWVNHHHLFQAVERVNGGVLWANVNLLFWLSLIPFVTAWAGDHGRASIPVAIYGVILLLAAIAYFILVRVLLSIHSKESKLARAIGRDFKGKISLLIYALAIPVSFLFTFGGWLLYIAVALLWLVPDRRIESTLQS
jgi:uncharacterized membrane protein